MAGEVCMEALDWDWLAWWNLAGQGTNEAGMARRRERVRGEERQAWCGVARIGPARQAWQRIA